MTQVPQSLQALAVPLTDLRTYGANPRKGDIDAIAESLRVNGQYRPVVVRRETMEILAGNHTFLAAQKLGWAEIAATFVDCGDEQAKRIVLADNRTAELATYDDPALIELLQSVEDLAGTGFSDADLEALLSPDSTLDDGDGDSELGADVFSIIVTCRDETQQRNLIERFDSEGLSCRPLMM